MPDNPSPAAQPDSGAAPAELNFEQPAAENPRMKRRNLKAKTAGLKPANAAPLASARELEREAPPLSAEAAVRTSTPVVETKPSPAAKVVEPPVKVSPPAPPRTKPTISLTSTPAASVTLNRLATASTPSASSATNATVGTDPKTSSSTTPTTSPHGTRPATLYYSSYPRKATSPPMKTNSPASPAASSTPSSSSANAPARPATSSATRPVATAAAAATAPRSTTAPIDYRANVERQTREQKSVGSILTYIVYAFIAVFLLCAGLASYGGTIIFAKLHEQSTNLSDLDSSYTRKDAELSARITATQDTLAQAQASVTRQQELINKQQEDINRLLNQINDNANATKGEAKARAQETAALRARIRDLENKSTPKY